MTPEQQMMFQCIQVAQQLNMATADKNEQSVVRIATVYYNAVVGSATPVPGKKDKSTKNVDPLS